LPEYATDTSAIGLTQGLETRDLRNLSQNWRKIVGVLWSKMTIQLHIKPLSINEAWQGKRFKTKKYKAYEKEVLLMLPSYEIPEGELDVRFEFGISKNSDVDNCCKSLLDILQKRYSFNDSRVMRIELIKKVVKKGQGYFNFSIKGYT